MATSGIAFSAADQLLRLPLSLETNADLSRVIAALRTRQAATLDGVWGSACALVAATLANHTSDLPLVVVFPKPGDADEFVDELPLFSVGEIRPFPVLENEPHRLLQDENYGDRLRTLKCLLDDRPPRFVVTSIQSLLQPVPNRSALQANTRRIKIGDRLDIDQLARWLTEHGYHSTSGVELTGEYSLRGGIIDVFANDWLDPMRIELFDDEVESIRQFDVASQRSLRTQASIEITVPGKTAPADDHFATYLPADSWFMLVEPDQLADEGKRFLERLERAEDHHSLPSAMQHIDRFARVTAAGIATATDQHTAHLNIESVERFTGDIARVREDLDKFSADQQVIVVAPTDAEVHRLQSILSSTALHATGRLHFHGGRLKAGFRLVDHSLVLLSSADLFYRADVRRVRKHHTGKVIDSFLDLREGDLVVHLAHGIGRYRGLKLLNKDDQVEEHLELEFHGGTKIFVPSSKIELVQKYVGGRKSRPRLAKIGGKAWLRQKQAVAAAVSDVAAEMLQVQAERASRTGIAFGPDTDWQSDFDAAFHYTETDDQLSAANAIKVDMHSLRPMDRLICGDVGFGKTELAMRAAFKAVDNGYQVAVLVPTTILAEQHFHTFSQRMAEFPFQIAKLSRFCSAREQRETVQGLKSGAIDIVIGTHRLASKDVAFANLGLLIIDEEQRFGVEVKDRLKTIRASVDVLTLTATPIPRTLHMSLTGIRDISNLETPPEDRIAVETRVTRWKRDLIRHAMLRELNRGGQIFFVHNRVHDIEALAEKLKFLVPEASLGIGHGQMPEADLEQVMVDFVQHRFDLLLATTIVESGLDIPNANTIFIDEANNYGLADLHQLRGRVGRYKHRAYCYLLVDPSRTLTPQAARRLRAIEEFSDMGAGFAIAMRDLEIRGAGNLLGTQQSGHIATVGYELYCQLLESAVRQLKKMPPKLKADVNVELPGEAYLPRSYVSDMRVKIDLYRRLARTTTTGELREELVDRFGTLPEPVQRMLSLAELKNDAAAWQLAAIHLEHPYLVFTYTDRNRAEHLVRASGGLLRLVDDSSIYLTLPQHISEPDAMIDLAKSVLRAS